MKYDWWKYKKKWRCSSEIRGTSDHFLCLGSIINDDGHIEEDVNKIKCYVGVEYFLTMKGKIANLLYNQQWYVSENELVVK